MPDLRKYLVERRCPCLEILDILETPAPIIYRATRRAPGTASRHRKARRLRSSTGSTRRSMKSSPIPRRRRGSPRSARYCCRARPRTSASWWQTRPRNGARWSSSPARRWIRTGTHQTAARSRICQTEDAPIATCVRRRRERNSSFVRAQTA